MKTNKILLAVMTHFSLQTMAVAGDVEIHLPTASDAMTVDQPAGTELMRVNGDGNVGIGTDAPSDGTANGGQPLKLDVEGAIGAISYCDENGENCQTILQLTSAGGGKFVDGTDTSDAVYTSGNVGVGTNEPGGQLHVAASGTIIPFMTDSEDGSASWWVHNSYRSSQYGPTLAFRKHHGTKTTPEAITTNSRIQEIHAQGYDGTTLADASSIVTVPTEDWSATDHGSRMDIYAGSPATGGKISLLSTGSVGVGTLTPSDGTANGGQALKVDVEGAVGASHFCDQNGENCVEATALSTGGGAGNATPADFAVMYADTTEAAGGATVSPSSATWVSNVTDTTMSPAGVVTFGAADAGFWTCSANGKSDDVTAASGWAAVYLLINGTDFHGNISQVQSGSFNYESTAWSGHLAAGDTLEVRINSSFGDDWVGIEMACAKSGVVTTTSGAVTVDPDPATNLTSNTEGDVVYDATDKELQVFDGSSWASVGGSGTKKQYLDSHVLIDHINNTGAVTNTQPNFDLSTLTTVPAWATHAIVMGRTLVAQSGGFTGSSNSSAIQLSHNGVNFNNFSVSAAYGGSGQADRSDDSNTQEVRIRDGNLIGFISSTTDGGNSGQSIQAMLYLIGFAGY